MHDLDISELGQATGFNANDTVIGESGSDAGPDLGNVGSNSDVDNDPAINGSM